MTIAETTKHEGDRLYMETASSISETKQHRCLRIYFGVGSVTNLKNNRPFISSVLLCDYASPEIRCLRVFKEARSTTILKQWAINWKTRNEEDGTWNSICFASAADYTREPRDYTINRLISNLKQLKARDCFSVLLITFSCLADGFLLSMLPCLPFHSMNLVCKLREKYKMKQKHPQMWMVNEYCFLTTDGLCSFSPIQLYQMDQKWS